MAANLTVSGLICQPQTVGPLNHNRLVEKKDFTPKAVLRQNLKALLESNAGPRSQSDFKRSKKKIAQSTVGRILRGENSRIETLGRIAEAYSLEPWQLLVPGMDPKNPPVLQPSTKEEKELWARLRGLMEDIKKQGGE